MTRSLTIGMAFYMNPGMLQIQFEALAALPLEMQLRLKYIVVDDGSPKGYRAEPPKLDALKVPVEIYRAKKDIPWNQDFCRNLAVKQSPKGWCLLTDMDHVPSAMLLHRCIHDDDLYEGCVYKFGRVTAPDNTPYKPHPNSWLITKAMYEKTGGYDERYRGIYGTDGMFARRVEQVSEGIVNLPEPLIRYPREVIADASTTTLERKSEANEAKKLKLRNILQQEKDNTPKTGLTDWERIF